MTEPSDTTPAPTNPSWLGRVWIFVRILNVRLRFILLMILVGLIAGHWDDLMNRYDRWRRPPRAPDAGAAEEIEYYCPMHPNIVRPELGNCPICGMPLSKRAKGSQAELPEGVLARVQLTPYRIQMGRIATTPVTYQLLSREIRTVGLVEYDETRRAYIAARIKGRIDRLLVNYVGQQVEKGDPLAEIYSPDLLVAQRELIEAAESLKQHPPGAGGPPTGAQTLVEGARRKLVLWGITEAQIDEILARGTPETHLTLYSPIRGIVTEKNVLEGHYVNEGDDLYTIADLRQLWLQVKIFDDQIAGVEIGQAVEVTSPAYPSEIFAGRIAFIAYNVDPATRTVAARVEVANPDYRLRPGMYLTAAIRLPVGRVTEIGATTARAPAATTPTATGPADESRAAPSESLAQAYLALAAAYAHDRTDRAAVTALAREARALTERGDEDLRRRARGIAGLAGQLVDKDLDAQRRLFMDISAQVIELLRASPPRGLTLFVAHCPMKNADWLQTSELVNNPFYGSEMLACGTITGRLETAGAASDERFASGYFCPIYPERLYDRAEQCPLDGFPFKYVKIEKLLAVPEMAVIDTGTRKVVYRESEPGTFEMVEVKLGPRAGELYPVLAGLAPGQRVATVGAFLVDAENRLNPAAAAQYFGASGGPQQSSGQQR